MRVADQWPILHINNSVSHLGLETTFETVKSAGSDLSLKTIAALRSNSEASFAHLEALVGAKSISEVIELQTAFLRHGVEKAYLAEVESWGARVATVGFTPVCLEYTVIMGAMRR